MIPTTSRRRVVLVVIALIVILGVVASVAAETPTTRPPLPQRYPVALITAVEPNGPAWRAGLEVHDRIVSVNDMRILKLEDLARALRDAGYSARLTVISYRTDQMTTVFVYPVAGRIGINARMVEMYPYYPFLLGDEYRY